MNAWIVFLLGSLISLALACAWAIVTKALGIEPGWDYFGWLSGVIISGLLVHYYWLLFDDWKARIIPRQAPPTEPPAGGGLMEDPITDSESMEQWRETITALMLWSERAGGDLTGPGLRRACGLSAEEWFVVTNGLVELGYAIKVNGKRTLFRPPYSPAGVVADIAAGDFEPPPYAAPALPRPDPPYPAEAEPVAA
jgi:hypothetical protein